MPDFKLLPSVNGTDVALDGHTHPGVPVAPVLWLDASRITGLADGAAVATWPDASGNGLDATQATGGKRPLYKVGVANGRPVVRFDGVDDTLACAAFASALTTPFTIVAVCRMAVSAIAENKYIVSSEDISDGGVLYAQNAGKAYAVYHLGGPITGAATDDWAVVSGIYDGASSSIQVNTAIVTGTTSAGTLPRVRLSSNRDGGQYPAVDIAEILVYDRGFTTLERQQIHRSLASDYGIPAPSSFASTVKWGTD